MRRRPVLLTLALVVALAVPAAIVAATATKAPDPPFAHMQMNLCLSGIAACSAGTQYPKVVEEAVTTIQRVHPASVVIAEACMRDAATIAERTGMYVSFTNVISFGAVLPCRNPDGRGPFGNAVLTRWAPVRAESRAFESQIGQEQRRWICVTGRDRETVCGTHLAVGGPDGTPNHATQEAQCAEFGQVLQTFSAGHTVIASGDMNRQSSCAPAGFWTLRDEDATQAKGIQHVYAEADAFVTPSKRVIPTAYTDHDALLVTAKLPSGR